jgi:hypothetical protein
MEKQKVLEEARKVLSPISFAVFDHLLEWLRQHDTPTAYEPVGLAVGLPHQHDNLDEYLGEITEYTHEKYQFLLSAIVHRAGKGEPGPGFPLLAWALNVRINSPLWYEQERMRMSEWARGLT